MLRPVGYPPTQDDLRELPILSELPDNIVEWLASHGDHLAFEAEDHLVEEGDPAQEMFLVLDGEARIFVREGNHVSIWNSYLRGSVTGFLPFSRMTHYVGVIIGIVPGRVLRIHRSLFGDMLKESLVLGERLVGMLSDRVRDATRIEQQREKMMALGRLSAGLAHELNNPAASVGRNAAELRRRLAELPDLVIALSGCGAGPEALRAAEEVRSQVAARPPARILTPVQRSEREDEVGAWLEAHNVPHPWLLAESFVESGFSDQDFSRLESAIPPPGLTAVVRWLEGELASARILGDIVEATGRISTLVGSVKSYSHMDRAPDPEEVDIRSGLDQTLVMLGHAIREKGIRVERTYEEELPRVWGFPGELNQVWTNLVDNALDAMGTGGVLTLRACSVDDRVVVELEDTGSGIPPEVLPRIFEPFFTTKPMGEGTGLGLDMVQRIIRRQHQGDIRVTSQPGNTRFTVVLPLDGARVPEMGNGNEGEDPGD